MNPMMPLKVARGGTGLFYCVSVVGGGLVGEEGASPRKDILAEI